MYLAYLPTYLPYIPYILYILHIPYILTHQSTNQPTNLSFLLIPSKPKYSNSTYLSCPPICLPTIQPLLNFLFGSSQDFLKLWSMYVASHICSSSFNSCMTWLEYWGGFEFLKFPFLIFCIIDQLKVIHYLIPSDIKGQKVFSDLPNQWCLIL